MDLGKEQREQLLPVLEKGWESKRGNGDELPCPGMALWDTGNVIPWNLTGKGRGVNDQGDPGEKSGNNGPEPRAWRSSGQVTFPTFPIQLWTFPAPPHPYPSQEIQDHVPEGREVGFFPAKRGSRDDPWKPSGEGAVAGQGGWSAAPPLESELP